MNSALRTQSQEFLAVRNLCDELLHSLRRELGEEKPNALQLDSDALALTGLRTRLERDFPGPHAAAAGDAFRTCAAAVASYTSSGEAPGSPRWREAMESVRQAHDRLLYWARVQEVRP